MDNQGEKKSAVPRETIRVKDIRSLISDPRPPDLIMVENKQCVTCKNTVQEEESSYLIWQGMYFCDTICLHWYHKTMLSENCSNCFAIITAECNGKFVFRFDQLLQFCSIPCFHEYQAKRKSCLFCMGKVLRFSVSAKQLDASYCSEECSLKHCKSQDVNMQLPDLGPECSICKSNINPITIHYQCGDHIKNICSETCLQAFASPLRVSSLLCCSCKMYFPARYSPAGMINKRKATTFCSKKCETHMIFLNLKIYPCEYCNIKRFDIDLIHRCSKIEPTVYLCSIDCYLKKYFAGQVPMSSNVTQLFTLGGINSVALNQPSTSTSNLKPIENINFPVPHKKDKTKRRNDVPLKEENLVPAYTKQVDYKQISSMNSTINKSSLFIRSQTTPDQKNVATMCFVQKADKSSCTKVTTCDNSTQTDLPTDKIALPIPIPIYIPVPMYMYSVPYPSPLPFPLPIPVPVFVPTTKNNSQKILEHIDEILMKYPKNPLEAEVLAIAEALCEQSNEYVETGSILSKNVTNSAMEAICADEIPNGFETSSSRMDMNSNKSSSISLELSTIKPKINWLDIRIGLIAFHQWLKSTKSVQVADRNNIDILLWPASQLSEYLAVFVTEVKRSKGQSYAPDTLYYLCLSLQKYLYENGINDNIFFDPGYEDFIFHLDNQMQSFPLLFVNSPVIVTRIEEEHLWDSKQFGVSSPYALLNTVLYCSMKYFHLLTAEEQLLFQIVGSLKFIQTKNGDKELHFYPHGKTAKYYKMTQNRENPERCPVCLFEFYCSKLSNVAKDNSGYFYFRPDPNCTGDSPIWYSTTNLEKVHLEIMMNRLRVVKELNSYSEDIFEED